MPPPCTRVLRRFKDTWTLTIVGLLGACILIWNYSYIPYSSKDSLPVIVSPLSSINTRRVHSEQLGGDAPPPPAKVIDDLLEGKIPHLPNKIPHPTTEVDIEITPLPYVKDEVESVEMVAKQSEPSKDKAKSLKDGVEQSKKDADGTQDGAEHPEENKAKENGKEKITEKPKSITSTGVPCPVIQTCPHHQFSYYSQSGNGVVSGPVICYNNELIVGKELKDDSYGRGANIVVIHPQFKTIMDRRTFDLYGSVDNCMEMARYLSTFVPFKGQILIASYDDMTANLCKSVKTLLNQYGSSLIKELKFRENFVLVGEKGLPGNFGFEKKEALNGKEWPAGPVNVSGCASYPISPKYVDVDIIDGYELENCGVQKCAYDEIEIHVSTVADNKRVPKLCIGNKYVFYPGLKGSRGFNLVELDPVSKSVIRSAEYDTYIVESTRLEIFLENVNEKHYLIAVVADDGSTSLKPHARQLLKTFGFNGDLITMRTALYFVGRKGMKITPIQRVSQPDSPKSWPGTINERFCLPAELTEATDQQVTNKARTEFCSKHDSFADFCFAHHKTEPLLSANKLQLYDKIQEVFNLPILVLGGVNNIAMSHTLQSLLKQPGLNKAKVFVAYSTMFGDDYKPFIELFEFNRIEIKPISRYVDFLTEAFAQFWKLNPRATHCIVIDDEIVAKAGFMWFMGHALLTMYKDDTIGAASAWNPQGFSTVASDPSAVHVLSQFAGQAFLIPKTFYNDEIKDKESACCNQRSIQQWFIHGTTKQYKYIVPEISRAGYFSPTAYSAQTQPLSNLAMSMPRTAASVNLTVVPLTMDTVLNFDSIVTENLKSAYFTNEHDLSICKNRKEPGSARLLAPFLPNDKKNVAVVYSQSTDNDYSTLKHLYMCFGLMYMDGYSPFGIYNGVTTLSMNDKRVYLVGTSSSFYKNTVQNLRPYILSF